MPSSPPDEHPDFFHSATFGTLCGLFAALAYTACNICLRAATDVDPFFVAAVRPVPTVVLLAPLMLMRPMQGLPLLPPARVLTLLIAVGLCAYVGGNSLFQYGLSIVGMALAVPLCLGSMIFCGATLGRVVLNEPVTPRMALGLLLLTSSIFVLSGGAKEAQQSMERINAVGGSHTPSLIETEHGSVLHSSPWQLTFGVAAACSSGLFYAVMGATIRHTTQGLSTVAQTLTIVSTAGMIALAGICWWTISSEEFAAITGAEVLMIALAGLFNAVAFVALTRALQLTSLVYVHALNATQAAMAAIAGILIFGEARSGFLFTGLALTIAGLVLMQGARRMKGRNDQ